MLPLVGAVTVLLLLGATAWARRHLMVGQINRSGKQAPMPYKEGFGVSYRRLARMHAKTCPRSRLRRRMRRLLLVEFLVLLVLVVFCVLPFCTLDSPPPMSQPDAPAGDDS